MAQNIQLKLNSHNLIGLFLVTMLSLKVRTACTGEEQIMMCNDTNVTSEIGSTLLDYSLTETLISDSLTFELNKTDFQETVCKWFDYYQDFDWQLSQLTTNNRSNVNISLVTFLLKTLTETNCNKVKIGCNDDQECSDMSCNINSIAIICLGMPIKMELLSATYNIYSASVGAQLEQLIECWMKENLSNENLIDGIFDSLVNVIEVTIPVECSLPLGNSTIDEINCIKSFTF